MSTVDAWRKMSQVLDASVMDKIARLGMSPRQMEMNQRWSWYSTTQYENRVADWDGQRHEDPVAREVIASAGFVPPGFKDMGRQLDDMFDLPLKHRRPSVPYHLVKVIVDRFTGLLFSERRNPKIDVVGDPIKEDFIKALVDGARLWSLLVQARKYGGATGSVLTGFQFVDGRPVVEVHDPRWVTPVFRDKSTHELVSWEKRYQYPCDERDPTGAWTQVGYWYRRVVDSRRDVLYKPQLVGEGEEPQWDGNEERVVEHGLGFCPAVWTQNIPVDDDIDGEPDCMGIYEICEGIDALLSQGHSGILANIDPTVAFEGTGDTEVPPVQKGNGHGIVVPVGTVKYLEAQASGPAAAREMAKELRSLALEVSQCVLDHPDVAGRTATEIERSYSSMLSKADVLREQYGQHLVLPLVNMMVRAAAALAAPRLVDGAVKRFSLSLPPRITDAGERIPRAPGSPDSVASIAWPSFFEPSLFDALTSAQAAGHARLAGILDEENAAKFIAPFFHVDDVAGMLKRLSDQREAQAASLQSDLMTQNRGALSGMGGVGAGPGHGDGRERPPGMRPRTGDGQGGV